MRAGGAGFAWVIDVRKGGDNSQHPPGLGPGGIGEANVGGADQAVAAVGRFSGMGICKAAAMKPNAMEPYHTQS